jgi:hypothetical protein
METTIMEFEVNGIVEARIPVPKDHAAGCNAYLARHRSSPLPWETLARIYLANRRAGVDLNDSPAHVAV